MIGLTDCENMISLWVGLLWKEEGVNALALRRIEHDCFTLWEFRGCSAVVFLSLFYPIVHVFALHVNCHQTVDVILTKNFSLHQGGATKRNKDIMSKYFLQCLANWFAQRIFFNTYLVLLGEIWNLIAGKMPIPHPLSYGHLPPPATFGWSQNTSSTLVE